MKDKTPAHLRCAWGGCPSVHELEGGSIAIIGRKGSRDPMSGESYFGHPIGDDEELVIIDKALLATIRDEVREECAIALRTLRDKKREILNHFEAVGAGASEINEASGSLDGVFDALGVIIALKETPDE